MVLIERNDDRLTGDDPASRLSERGIALVLVLWLTLVLSITAASVTRVARGDVRIAYNVQEAAKARALADGGYYLAVAALMKTSSADPWPIDGTVREVAIGGALIEVSILDEALKTNLNAASGEMLEAAFLSSGVDEQTAAYLGAALVAERLSRRGSPTPSAGVAGLLTPPNQFSTIRELQSVLGLNAADYARLRDVFTVYIGGNSRRGEFIRRPASRQARRLAVSAPQDAQPKSLASTYAISSTVRLNSGASFNRYAVVRVSAGTARGPQVLHWD